MTNTTYKFDPITRKALVTAMQKILACPIKYLGMPTAAYELNDGEYHLTKDGTLTGPENPELLEALMAAGFAPEANPPKPAVYARLSREAPADETDCVSIEMPLTGFDPPALDRLGAMVAAKEALIKKALNVGELPIQLLEDRIAFPWFSSTDGAEVDAYAQFITALAKTAREKKRVTAKAPADGFENEAFAMRVFCIGLGLIGPQYKLTRALMGRNLEGSSAWRYGPPEKAPAIQEAGIRDQETGDAEPAAE
ncbi:MAG: hypothetical protein LBB66_01860 [Desulfovibrio sp.]|jgi:hypothetical protein|nr:hypothetical protein [Desulfovibrio sp.]